jgi:hypothetical protein
MEQSRSGNDGVWQGAGLEGMCAAMRAKVTHATSLLLVSIQFLLKATLTHATSKVLAAGSVAVLFALVGDRAEMVLAPQAENTGQPENQQDIIEKMKSATQYVLTEGSREARLRLEGRVFCFQ